jgi:hypothetical protein
LSSVLEDVFESTVTDDTVSQLTAAAGRAADAVGEGEGHAYGSAVHSAFQEEVDALGDSSLKTEQSFLNGKPVTYGTKDSVRPDVTEFDGQGNIKAVYDLKTGGATMSAARMQQIWEAIKVVVPIIVIRVP